jgi:hypothetical protein
MIIIVVIVSPDTHEWGTGDTSPSAILRDELQRVIVPP